jgi:GT2 family glycosyltransferase
MLESGIRRLDVPAQAPANAMHGVHVDAIFGVDSNCFYIRGWARDSESKPAGLTVVSPEGVRVGILENLFTLNRPDVDKAFGTTADRGTKAGFIACFEVPGSPPGSGGWLVEMRTSRGDVLKTTVPEIIRDDALMRDSILGDLALEAPATDHLVRNHAFPALTRIQERTRTSASADSVREYGPVPQSPPVSVVVPLYGRVDFLEQQLAQFVHDPEISASDLIYVLDSPELADGMVALAPHLFSLYRVPFRLVVMRQNAGFSGASNVGAAQARGRLLLLLNSDILPDRPGWLGQMVAFYDNTSGIGALGPKLLYEDDSLQHAGMYFEKQTGRSSWDNQHYFKGLHRSLPEANVRRAVPAVTAACMMIERELYIRLDGLRNIYVKGDYEDSDLCLRLLEAGRQNWYLPEVELYHLEGQSYAPPQRSLASRYNAWLHTHLWNDRIVQVMGRHSSPL